MTDPVARLNAALEGRYKIERQLGEGGMATVYLAKDLKHNRNVALKVLKPELAAVVGAERFLAEIETTANLQHPHILPLFDSGQADSFLFYVMPYVEGESLRDRLDRDHQLPVEEAVAIATKVAGALQAAHEKSVIHRDIKPANILLSKGEPLVADFGIALAVSSAGGGRLTETGLSLGTPHYMSPEQATGDQSVGPATDIYALGCVLYEMLVGDPPFVGSTPQAVLGKIISGSPEPVTQHRKTVPLNVEATINKALEKVPADRFPSAREFARALGDFSFGLGDGTLAGVAGGVGPWNRLTVIGWSVAALATLAFGWALLRPGPAAPVERFKLDIGTAGDLALLPDGSGVIYPANGRLMLRRWEALDPVPISGTENAESLVGRVAVSPSGTEVSFVTTSQQLKVATLAGGVVRILVDEGVSCCLRWGPDGFIYYSPLPERNIRRVLATGGADEVVTRRGEEGFHGFFRLLPGGEVAVFSTTIPPYRIEAMRMSTGERKVITEGVKPYYTSTGHLVFVSPDGQIVAAPFDPDAMALTGPAVPLGQGVTFTNFIPQYSLSQNGTLVYITAASMREYEFVWVTRSGEATPVDAGWSFRVGADVSRGWSLSPDGTRLAFREEADAGYDIWVKQLPDGPLSRLTFDQIMEAKPRWTPDGRSVTFLSDRSGNHDVWSKPADGTGEPRVLFDGGDLLGSGEGFWSPVGEWLVLRTGLGGVSGRDILALRPGVDSVPLPLLTEEYNEEAAALSPDGRWLAYGSNETGSREVYVRPFPDVDSGRWQVSTDGGIMPVWAHSGRELFFVDGSRALIAVEVETDPTFQVGAKETLFTLPVDYLSIAVSALYDIAPDDQRFLMVRGYQADAEGDAAPSEIILVQNFFEELKRLVPN